MGGRVLQAPDHPAFAPEPWPDPSPCPYVPPPGSLPAHRRCPPLNRRAVSTPQQRSGRSPSSARRCLNPAHAPAHWPPQARRAQRTMPSAAAGATHPATPPLLPARKSSFLLQRARYSKRAAPAGNSNLSERVPARFAFQSCPGAPGAESRSDGGLGTFIQFTGNHFLRETVPL